MNKRNTIQRDIVLNTVINLRGHVTADEVYEKINSEYPNISKGTVYRNLSILSEEGKIRKIGIPDGSDIYDFTLKEHYHVRCIMCGMVSDVDMDAIPDMIERIHNTNGMKFLDYDILFRGICPACQSKNETEK